MPTQTLQNSQKTQVSRAFLSLTERGRRQLIVVDSFLTLGRGPSNTIQLEDPFVSERHLRIEKKGRGFLLTDLRSRNGTLVNGTLISEAWLQDQDRIQVGEREIIFSIRKPEEDPTQFYSSKNSSWQEQLHRIPSMAKTQFPVLITGASGTGKEILARLIHEKSTRKTEPFVSVNCSALSENLIESELFGHIKGSFTGAEQNRKGAFQSAQGGTLFLDEIGDLPLSLQPKLLRALENNEVRPVGSDQNISINVRIVAATHSTLKNKVQKGEFREDLYYRLHVLQIHPPQLKHRLEDFESLLYTFAKKYKVSFSFAAIQHLKSHSWPGNIRELKNAVARASALFTSDRVDLDQARTLIDPIPTQNSLDLKKNLNLSNFQDLKSVEKQLICKKLIETKGNQKQAAEALGIPKSTLHDRIRSYQINIKEMLQEAMV